jgi:hypothetical protein
MITKLGWVGVAVIMAVWSWEQPIRHGHERSPRRLPWQNTPWRGSGPVR